MRAGRAAAAGMCAAAAFLILTGCSSAGARSEDGNVLKRAEQTGKSVESWYFDAFDENLRAAYKAFERSAASPRNSDPVSICDESGSFSDMPLSGLNRAYQGFLYDNPQLFWLGRSYSYRVSRASEEGEYADAVMVTALTASQDELDECTQRFESAAGEILDSVQKAEDDRQRAEMIYESLTDGAEYVEDALYDESLYFEHTAYGALVSKRAVCDGFALAYKYLLDRCGIPSVLIPGESSGQPHVWNTVYWDGAWHETDITWDAASGDNNSKQYFDLTTEEMSKDHLRESGGIADLAPIAQ